MITTASNSEFSFEDFSYIAGHKGPLFLCGVDEVGRGPLAGPVVACGVALQLEKVSELKSYLQELWHLGVRDSKKLSSLQRKKVLESLKKSSLPFRFSIQERSPQVIDDINILQASLESMKSCFLQLIKAYSEVKKGIVLIDGNRLPSLKDLPLRPILELKSIVKGDQKCGLIALASVIAKEYRDNLMIRLHEEYPQYGWAQNAGYPTLQHREAILRYGLTPHHRRSFCRSNIAP